jgi:hypothetical protein
MIGVVLNPVFDLSIKTATSALRIIHYISEFNVFVAEVAEKINVHVVPREFNLSCGLLLSCCWMKEVKIRGNYELDKYDIQEPDDGYYEIHCANMPRVSSV